MKFKYIYLFFCIAILGGLVVLNRQSLNNTSYSVIEKTLSPISATKKIEVVAFFAYQCPYCNEIDGELNRWINDHANEVALIRKPFQLTNDGLSSRLFFTLDKMQIENEVHSSIFNEIHQQGNHFYQTEEGIFHWAKSLNERQMVFLSYWQSEEMNNQLRDSAELAHLYEVNAVPTIIMNQHMVTSPNHLIHSTLGFAPGSLTNALDLMLIESKK